MRRSSCRSKAVQVEALLSATVPKVHQYDTGSCLERTGEPSAARSLQRKGEVKQRKDGGGRFPELDWLRRFDCTPPAEPPASAARLTRSQERKSLQWLWTLAVVSFSRPPEGVACSYWAAG